MITEATILTGDEYQDEDDDPDPRSTFWLLCGCSVIVLCGNLGYAALIWMALQ